MVSAARKIDALTPRQREILQGMVAGHSNKVMARHFGLSPRTIETHRAHMLVRLGAANIADAIRIANDAKLPRLEHGSNPATKLSETTERPTPPQQGQLALS